MKQLEEKIAAKDRRGTLEAFLPAVEAFTGFPVYNLYVLYPGSLEHEIVRTFLSDDNEFALADRILSDDSSILNKYLWARDDLLLTQHRYA